MDDAALVRGLDRRRDLDAQRERLARRQRAAREPRGERLALDQLEHEVRRARPASSRP